MRLTELTEKGYYDLSKRLMRYYLIPLLLGNNKKGTFNVLDIQFEDYHMEHMGNPPDLKEYIADLVKSYVNLETKQSDNRKNLVMIVKVRAITHNYPYRGSYIAERKIPICWD